MEPGADIEVSRVSTAAVRRSKVGSADLYVCQVRKTFIQCAVCSQIAVPSGRPVDARRSTTAYRAGALIQGPLKANRALLSSLSGGGLVQNPLHQIADPLRIFLMRKVPQTG